MGGSRPILNVAVARALQLPRAYPGDVGPVTVVESHRSWVFLTEQHAFKLRKRRTDGAADSLNAQWRACEREVELNRRFSPGVYLGTVPVTLADAGFQVAGRGRVVDWLVQMVRLPRAEMLDELIRTHRVDAARVDRLAEVLADFYERAEPVALDARAYSARLAADIEAKGRSLAHERYHVDRRTLAAVLHAQRRWLASHQALLERRARRVVEGHGDLRPEHICLHGAPRIIDCLDFDRALRALDPVWELAFLRLECLRLGAGWVGDLVLEGYAHRTRDVPAATLVAFYESHHALIRGALAVWHLDDGYAEDAWSARANEYLQIAARLLRVRDHEVREVEQRRVFVEAADRRGHEGG